jgi:hypothetical protein
MTAHRSNNNSSHRTGYFTRPSLEWDIIGFLDHMIRHYASTPSSSFLNLWVTTLSKVARCRCPRHCCEGQDRESARMLLRQFRSRVSLFMSHSAQVSNNVGYHRTRGAICSSRRLKWLSGRLPGMVFAPFNAVDVVVCHVDRGDLNDLQDDHLFHRVACRGWPLRHLMQATLSVLVPLWTKPRGIICSSR